MIDLFTPLTLGNLSLKNRIVMAPMTRSRAATDGSPNSMMVEYYKQRATAGLIITEGVYPSEDGKGYCRTPGIVSAKHKSEWKKIVDVVKNQGGAIVMQLMHCGRIAVSENKQSGARTVAPSAIRAKGEMFTATGMKPFDKPNMLTSSEISEVIQQHCNATESAFEIGFDGVELHCTSGYLPAQFLSTGTNSRSDKYGGTVENRVRFVSELLQKMSDIDGSGRIGLRICPANTFNDLHDDNPLITYQTLLRTIEPLKLAYLHAIKSPDKNINVATLAKEYFKGPLIVNGGFTKESGQLVVQSKNAEAVSFGQYFIANPNLPERFKNDIPLQELNPQYLYSGDEKGYIDYE